MYSGIGTGTAGMAIAGPIYQRASKRAQLINLVLYAYTGLMIIASHQTFSGQIGHMSDQIKFGQSNFLYIINGSFMEFAKENECPDSFQSLS